MFSVVILVVEIIIMSFLNSLSQENISNLFIVVMIGIQSLAVMGDINRNKYFSRVQIPLTIAYFWRLFLLFFDIYGKSIFVLPNSSSDAVTFYNEAVAYALTGVSGTHGKIFSAIMGTLFSWVGTSKLYGGFIIMLFSIVSLLAFTMILYILEVDEDAIYGSVGLAGLLPNFAILSVVFMRESSVTMMLSISLLFLALWLKKSNIGYYILAFVFAFGAAAFHSGSVAIAAGYIVILLLYDREEQRFHFKAGNVFLTLIFVFTFAYLFQNYADTFFSKMLRVDSISDVGVVEAKGGSSYAAYVGSSSSIADMAVYTIPRILYFLFSPFPWQWRSISDVIAFVFSSVYYFAVIWSAISYLRSEETKNRSLIIAFLIVALCTTFVFAWGVTNTGTATRHREKMVILFGIVYALSKDRSDKQQRWVTFGDRRIL